MDNTQEGTKWRKPSSVDIRYRGTESMPKESENTEKTQETVSAECTFHRLEAGSEGSESCSSWEEGTVQRGEGPEV